MSVFTSKEIIAVKIIDDINSQIHLLCPLQSAPTAQVTYQFLGENNAGREKSYFVW